MRKSVIGTSVAGVLDDWLTRGGSRSWPGAVDPRCGRLQRGPTRARVDAFELSTSVADS